MTSASRPCVRVCVRGRSLWKPARAFHRIFRLLRPAPVRSIGRRARTQRGRKRGDATRGDARARGGFARGKWRVIAASCYRILHLRRCFWCIAARIRANTVNSITRWRNAYAVARAVLCVISGWNCRVHPTLERDEESLIGVSCHSFERSKDETSETFIQRNTTISAHRK